MSLIQVGFGENPQEALFGKCKLLKLRLGSKESMAGRAENRKMTIVSLDGLELS
jgi:hypothetical protein